MENLPGEIIVDILSRLPVKSLLQFRCVSKQWCTLISDPQFSKSHLKRASKDHQRVLLLPLLDQSESVLSFDADCAVVEQIEVPFKGSNFGLTVLGSCNGLVCLCCRKEMFLWNPSTRAYKRLRKPRFVNYGYFFGGVGYDSSIDDYKVVRAAVLCYCHDRDGIVVKGSVIRVEVYTLRTNTWKRIDDLNNVNLIYHKLGYFFNGALHWQMNRGHDDVIVSFDLVEEKFQEMLPLPDEGEETNVNNRLGVLGGRLCIYRPSVEKHEVLTMEDYKIKASWTKLMDIPLRTIFDYKLLMPLCYTKNGEILMKVGEMIVVIYNLKENTWRKVPNPEGMSYFDASVYVESLISPNGLQTYNQRQGRMMKKRRQG